jgi:replicative DNA helicase
MLSDLRESGCLTADTRLMRADTNTEISLGELMARNVRDIPVWALDDRLKLVPRTLTHAFPSGVKEVFRVRLASGRQVTATANHPFLTYDGWTPLAELQTGSRVGVARHVPPPLEISPMDEDELLLRSHEKFVPASVFSAPKVQVSLFLRHLWAADGSVRWDVEREQARIHYASTSRRLIDDVARLLLRFNVFGQIKRVAKAGYRTSYHLDVYGSDNQRRFLEEIGVHGARGKQVMQCLAALRGVKSNTNVDTVPTQVWSQVREALVDPKMTHREFAAATDPKFCGSTLWKRAPSRQRLAAVANVLGDADLEVMATNDVFWDRIVSIEGSGEQEVYDATVLGVHNFVANGIPLHNSLEQDADMVMLLHREDAYEKESTRPGEADLIVAKHRNGPTKDIVLAFQGHYSRFVDMAHG